jgi:hypothetical protein
MTDAFVALWTAERIPKGLRASPTMPGLRCAPFRLLTSLQSGPKDAVDINGFGDVFQVFAADFLQ